MCNVGDIVVVHWGAKNTNGEKKADLAKVLSVKANKKYYISWLNGDGEEHVHLNEIHSKVTKWDGNGKTPSALEAEISLIGQ